MSTLTPGETIGTNRKDQCGVNGELSTIEEWEPVSDDFQSSTIVTCDWQVQVPNEQVGGDAGTCLAAHPCSSAFDREAAIGQYTCPRARCAVVAKDVEWTATPAGTRRQGQRKPQAEKKHAEKLRREAREGRRRHGQEGKSSKRARLRTHESLLCRCESRPQHFCVEVSLRSLSSEKLPAVGGHTRVHLVKIHLSRTQSIQQRQPIRTIVPYLGQLETTRHGSVSVTLADSMQAICPTAQEGGTC